MRRILSVSLLALLFAILLPLLLIHTSEPPEPADMPSEALAEPTATPTPEPPETEPEPEPTPPPLPDGSLDAGFTLFVLLEDELHEMTMADFLQGVVAAEMPALFHEDALKAQAVAARTYTLHRKLVTPTPRHPEADVCGDFTCCQAYADVDTLQERWGEDFDKFRARIATAVQATDGQILLYDDRPILAAFHAASYGYTEASGAIWGEAVPYLQSVPSHEGVAQVPRFYYDVEIPFSTFRETVLSHHPAAVLDPDRVPDWISDMVYTDSGRLDTLNIGGVTVRGTQFRQMFSLRSTAVQFSFSDTTLTVTTGGHGHGVGMSQFGANTMATAGYTYQEILDWYYTGVTWSDVAALTSFAIE